jgi:YidC/Oxa1 family membrane protein insertase
MGMDRNQVIGFVLIGILLIGMFAINSRNRLAYEAEQKKIADSLAALKPSVPADTTHQVTLAQPIKSAGLSGFSMAGTVPTTAILENDVLKISFSSKGGQPSRVEMKKYVRFDKTPVVIQSGDFNELSYRINTGNNHTEQTADLMFSPGPVQVNEDGSRSISFTAGDSLGHKLIHTYTLRNSDYMLDCRIAMEGARDLITGRKWTLNWKAEAPQVEKNHAFESSQSQVCYLSKEKFDFEYLGNGDKISLNGPTQWVALKQQFFARVLIAGNNFDEAPTSWVIPADSNEKFIARSVTQASATLPEGSSVSVPLKIYYGPSDYKILRTYGYQLEKIVPYGSGPFAFVKYINRFVLLPVFDFFQKHIANLGIVILLLTLFIRLITSPILYKSYLSGAKMKALKPEVDALKAKFTDPKTQQLDQQAFSMEQMNLWRSAGVSPLGGCLPALLQIPIFMSLYYFFQANIDLRGHHFLWAEDLASFDSIAQFSFSIPFYGDHVSLFTLTATATSLLISVYSMSNMQDNSNPMMKYMPYIFPVILLGVFNSLPSALTWYYTVSNVITLIMQIVIQKYIIDHDKIVAEIAENRKKPAKQSKFQERLQAMQESQRKLQEMKKKSSGS